MGDVVRPLRRHLSPDLVAPPAFDWICALCDRFPPGSGLILERRLDDDAATVDLSLRFDMVEIRAGKASSGPAHTAGERLRQMVTGGEWPDGGLAWLEFDHAAGPAGTPSVFVSLADPGGRTEAIVRAAEILGARPLGAAVARRLRQVLRTLPASPTPLQIGLMLGRPNPALRICAAMRRDEIPSALDGLGLAHRWPAIADCLAQPGLADAAPLRLDLDVREDLGPVLGVEIAPDSAAGWSRHLHALAALGLCRSSEIAGLEAWPGHDGRLHGLRVEDTSLRPPADAAAHALQVRTLNHSKLVFAPGRPVRAKIYLYAGFVWPRGVTRFSGVSRCPA